MDRASTAEGAEDILGAVDRAGDRVVGLGQMAGRCGGEIGSGVAGADCGSADGGNTVNAGGSECGQVFAGVCQVAGDVGDIGGRLLQAVGKRGGRCGDAEDAGGHHKRQNKREHFTEFFHWGFHLS